MVLHLQINKSDKVYLQKWLLFSHVLPWPCISRIFDMWTKYTPAKSTFAKMNLKLTWSYNIYILKMYTENYFLLWFVGRTEKCNAIYTYICMYIKLLIQGAFSECASIQYLSICPTGCLIVSPGSSNVTTSQVILSGGEGYINLRIGELKKLIIVVLNCLKTV